jgi:hypothetical protein
MSWTVTVASDGSPKNNLRLCFQASVAAPLGPVDNTGSLHCTCALLLFPLFVQCTSQSQLHFSAPLPVPRLQRCWFRLAPSESRPPSPPQIIPSINLPPPVRPLQRTRQSQSVQLASLPTRLHHLPSSLSLQSLSWPPVALCWAPPETLWAFNPAFVPGRRPAICILLARLPSSHKSQPAPQPVHPGLHAASLFTTTARQASLFVVTRV